MSGNSAAGLELVFFAGLVAWLFYYSRQTTAAAKTEQQSEKPAEPPRPTE